MRASKLRAGAGGETGARLFALALVLAAAPALAEPLLPGDRANATRLWRLQCAGCHGAGEAPTAIGRTLGAPWLRDATFLAARDDDQLIATMLKGGPGPNSPALGGSLDLLDAADLVAFLRAGLPTVSDIFTDAAAYTGKRYKLQGPAQQRAERLSGGDLTPAETELTIFSVYGGERPALGARLVPQDPVSLDELPMKAKKGYVVFGELTGPAGDAQPVAMGLGLDFAVTRLAASSQGPELSRVAPAVVGKGGRDPGKRKPFVSKTAPGPARALTRLYARAVEAAALAAKEEADRHLFDAPEKSAASKEVP